MKNSNGMCMFECCEKLHAPLSAQIGMKPCELLQNCMKCSSQIVQNAAHIIFELHE